MTVITIAKAAPSDLEAVLRMRYETMRTVCGFPQDYVFSGEFLHESEQYFRSGDQTTVLAWEDGEAVGCASICYVHVMPTYSHPNGKRAHLMNVYVKESHRRKGIARAMLDHLLADAVKRRVTQITLDATEMGRSLYETLGFRATKEGMVLNLK